MLLSYADGNGPIVTDLAWQGGRGASTLVVSFDGPLDPGRAVDPSNYRVSRVTGQDPEFVNRGGPVAAIRSADYDATTQQVTLSLARPLAAGAFYRVGIASGGLVDTSGTLFDGDDDDTAGGDFYALFGRGTTLQFSDLGGDRATVQVRGGGEVQAWRGLNGDVNQLSIVGATPGRTALVGSVRPAKTGDGVVVIPTIVGLAGVADLLPAASFPAQPPAESSPTPVVATTANLAYTLQIDPVAVPALPSLQSAVYTESGGKWLFFGGRTNGLHDFTPSGDANFPTRFQNPDILVVDPATGQVWTKPWSETGLPDSVIAPLASTNQQFTRKGDRLYAVGGYSQDASTGTFTTYDTLSAMSVSGIIDAVVNGGDVAPLIRQVHDPRLRVTGGELRTIGDRNYLVFGQDFQGGYNGATADFLQVYTDEVRSFRIVDNRATLGLAGYQSQRDPAQFRRRDYNLSETILPNGRQALTAFGGVFTPTGNGYRNPVVISPDGKARVDTHYQQYFSQYDSAKLALFDARSRAMSTVFFGGISLYDYDFATGTLAADTGLPFVDDVTSLVRRADGSTREFIMPSQLPALLGAEASFLAAPGVPAYSNGVIKLDRLSGPTTLGYIYGGIYSTVPNTSTPLSQTTSSNLVFRVTLVPTGAPL